MAEKSKKKPGRPKKYTKKSLETAVERYFDSITFVQTARDQSGKEIRNRHGEKIMVECYAAPPSKMGLCLFLGIDRGTWLNYSDHEQHPELKKITEYVNMRIEAYLESELVRREKGVDGIKFNLSNNYGWSAKKEVEIGEKTRNALSIDTMTMAEKMATLRSAMEHIGEGGIAENFDDEAAEEE